MPGPTSDCRATERKHPWPMVRLGELGTMVRGNGIRRCETVESGCPCLRYGEIYTSFNVILDKPRSFVPKELFDRSVKIKKGDLVFTLTGENTEEIAKALAYLGEGEIAAGGDLAVWTGHGCDSKYLAYLMYSPQLISQKAATGNGNIVVHTSIKKLQQLEIPLPPLPVQREIVARLERELAAVEKMKKGFEALAETAKQEFKAELKEVFEDSRYALEPLSKYCSFTGGSQPPKSSFIYEPKDGYVRLYQIRDYNGDPKPTYIKASDAKKMSRRGDIMIGRYGASIGLVFWAEDGAYNVAMVKVLINSSTILPEFVFEALHTPRIQSVFHSASRNAQAGFNESEWNKMELPVPPLPVQREVVVRLDLVKARAEKLEAKAREGVAVCETMRKAILKEAFE